MNCFIHSFIHSFEGVLGSASFHWVPYQNIQSPSTRIDPSKYVKVQNKSARISQNIGEMLIFGNVACIIPKNPEKSRKIPKNQVMDGEGEESIERGRSLFQRILNYRGEIYIWQRGMDYPIKSQKIPKNPEKSRKIPKK